MKFLRKLWIPMTVIVLVFFGQVILRLILGYDVLSVNVFTANYFSIGVLATGVFAIGVVSVGVFSIGIFSFGVFTVGVFAIGLIVAMAKFKMIVFGKKDVPTQTKS